MTDTDKSTFMLKNGAEIDGGVGLETWRTLQILADDEPDHLASLLVLAERNGESVPPAHRAALREQLFLRADMTEVVDHVRDVLLSAAHHSPEGLVLVNPFRVPSHDVARSLGRADAEMTDRWLRFTRGRDPGPDDGRSFGGR